MIYLLATLSFCLEIVRDFDCFIISTVFLVFVIIFLANDQPAVFSLKWFLIGFCCFLIIFLNALVLLPEEENNGEH